MSELVGHGVYTAVPDDLPNGVQSRQAVVVGRPDTAAARGARIPGEVRRRPNIQVRYRTELSWAVGIDHLEAVVLRHLTSGRIEACNADAPLSALRGAGDGCVECLLT